MDVDRWVDRIYQESDIGRGIATTVAGVIGLSIYLYSQDWVTAAFATIIAFPIFRIAASVVHSRLQRRKEKVLSEEELRELFDKLSDVEKSVVSSFVRLGGCVVTYSQVNRGPINFSNVGIESLMHRGLLHNTMTADGMQEAFVLDAKIFDFGKRVLPDGNDF